MGNDTVFVLICYCGYSNMGLLWHQQEWRICVHDVTLRGRFWWFCFWGCQVTYGGYEENGNPGGIKNSDKISNEFEIRHVMSCHVMFVSQNWFSCFQNASNNLPPMLDFFSSRPWWMITNVWKMSLDWMVICQWYIGVTEFEESSFFKETVLWKVLLVDEWVV